MSSQQLLGQASLVGAESRIKSAAYTAGDGSRHTFDFEEVSVTVTKRTTTFEFADIDGGYVQENGHGPEEYPLRCIFSGIDHDLDANDFQKALLLRGKGRLEHPLYGTLDVVSTGSIQKRNDLVGAVNETIIEVTFSTTLASLYPSGAGYPTSEIAAAAARFSDTAADQFENSVALSDAANQARAKVTVKSALQLVTTFLGAISDQVASSRRDFEARNRAINDGLDVLLGTPTQLATQIIGLVNAPARAQVALRERLDAYAQLLEALIGGLDKTTTVQFGEQAEIERINNFLIVDLFATASAIAVAQAVASSTYSSRPEALSAALTINEHQSTLVDWREEKLATFALIERGGTYQSLAYVNARAVGYLIETSYELVPERVIYTDRDRSFVDICAELYGSISEERLQYFIDTNQIGGDEFLEIPKGRRIVWYAA